MNNTILTEAFKQLKVLEEEAFDINSIDGVEDAKDFVEEDDSEDIVDIIDVYAEEEDELADSYVGKVILECNVCHSKIFEDADKVEIEGEDANLEEECPYCFSMDGYKVIGQVAPMGQVEEEIEITEEEPIDDEIADDIESEVPEEEVTEDEIVEESFRRKRRGKKINESKRTRKNRKISESYAEKVFKGPGLYDIYYYMIGVDGEETEDILYNGESQEIEEPSDLQDIIDDINSHDSGKYVWNFNYCEKVGELEESLNECGKLKKGKCKNDALNESTQKTHVVEALRTIDVGGIEDIIPDGVDVDEFKNKLQQNDCVVKGDEVYILKGTRFKLTPSGYFDYVVKIGDVEFDNWGTSPEEGEERGLFTLIMDESLNEGDSCPECGKNPCECEKDLEEDFKDVSITTDDSHMTMTSDEDGKVTVTTEPIKDEIEDDFMADEIGGDEMIAPIDDETMTEITDEPIEEPTIDDGEEEIDIDMDEFDDEGFDELGESYLKKVYENVNSFKTTGIKERGNKIKLEGIIGFTSGSKKKTSFIFEAKDISAKGKLRLIGENQEITRGKKAFTVSGRMRGKKFMCESFNYNYRAKNEKGKSTRLYGTIKRK